LNPSRILGETREKTNRFGRLENYVHGNLEDALLKLNSLKTRKKPQESEIFLKIYF
jgi:hypothetical protein